MVGTDTPAASASIERVTRPLANASSTIERVRLIFALGRPILKFLSITWVIQKIGIGIISDQVDVEIGQIRLALYDC
jgi:hypothetical protein